MTSLSIQFIDLAAQQRRIKSEIDAALERTLAHGNYIMGPEVAEFEAQLSAFCGARHAIGCSNGTDALALCLMAEGIKPGQAVFCPSFTFAATAEVVAWLGAVPFFVDIDEPTFNMSPASLKAAIREARERGLTPGAIISVDLFGRPADYNEIEAIAAEERIALICDAAQGFGAVYQGRKVGTIGAMTSTSFFPAKPLGCYGDGGAIFLDDDEKAGVIRSLIVHGKGTDKYDNVRIGMNGRLDTMQAGILIEKLRIFPDEIQARNRVAEAYHSGLKDVVLTPGAPADGVSVWAQYTIRLQSGVREAVQSELKQRGIPTAIYYPKPLHQQVAYRSFPTVSGGLPVTDRLSSEVLSLPMHPYLSGEAQEYIISSLREIMERHG